MTSTRLRCRALFCVSLMEWENPRGGQRVTWQCGIRKYTANLGTVGLPSSWLGPKKSVNQLIGNLAGYGGEPRTVKIMLSLIRMVRKCAFLQSDCIRYAALSCSHEFCVNFGFL